MNKILSKECSRHSQRTPRLIVWWSMNLNFLERFPLLYNWLQAHGSVRNMPAWYRWLHSSERFSWCRCWFWQFRRIIFLIPGIGCAFSLRNAHWSEYWFWQSKTWSESYFCWSVWCCCLYRGRDCWPSWSDWSWWIFPVNIKSRGDWYRNRVSYRESIGYAPNFSGHR